jgi:hypothetical protein
MSIVITMTVINVLKLEIFNLKRKKIWPVGYLPECS